MYQNEYEKALEYLKTAGDCVRDLGNLNRCDQNIHNFERSQAWQCLQDMICEYEVQIKLFGVLIDGKKIIHNLDPQSVSDDDVKDQLLYLQRHIPLYVLMRKGEETLAKKLGQWISGKHSEDKNDTTNKTTN